MKKKIVLTALLALSALLCSCREPVEANAETSAVKEVTVSEPVDCCGGEIPDCCKEKEETQSDCCKNHKS